MDRCREYFGFTVWFAGIGYAVLWPLTADGDSGRLFGASVVCGRSSGGMMAALCHLPHLLTLPIGLHVLGFVAAALVAVRLLCRVLRRLWPRCTFIPVEELAARLPSVLSGRSRRKPARPVRPAKPRAHFGLRGVPH